MFGIAAVKASSRKARVKSQTRRAFRRLEGFEPLEKREVLSASGLAGAMLHVDLDVAVRGTDVQYSPLGLPSSMAGDIYSAAGATRIGHYQEALQPILMDVTGDGLPDFVGTTGVATFDFFAGPSGNAIFGSITTSDTSYITGFTADGHILVGSQGTITAGTGALGHVSGGFASQSTVGFAPVFDMQTNIHFSVNVPLKAAFVDLVMVNLDHYGAGGKSNAAASHDATPQRGDDQHQGVDAPHIGLQRVVSSNDHHQTSGGSSYASSVDRNLEGDTDWRFEEVAATSHGGRR